VALAHRLDAIAEPVLDPDLQADFFADLPDCGPFCRLAWLDLA